MKTNIQKKVYKIKYGSTPIMADARKKEVVDSDSFNIESLNIVATDVYDALSISENRMLEIEKQWRKEGEQLFIESVELVATLDTL